MVPSVSMTKCAHVSFDTMRGRGGGCTVTEGAVEGEAGFVLGFGGDGEEGAEWTLPPVHAAATTTATKATPPRAHRAYQLRLVSSDMVLLRAYWPYIRPPRPERGTGRGGNRAPVRLWEAERLAGFLQVRRHRTWIAIKPRS